MSRHEIKAGMTALFVAGSLTVASVAVAVSTAHFRASTFEELDKGHPQGTLVSSEGEVLAGLSANKITGPDSAMFWASARAANGTVYFGSGNPGKLYAVRGSNLRLVADLKCLLVTALVAGPGKTLYAATMPDARVLSIDTTTGKWKQLAKLPTAHVWSLLYQPKAKRVLAATGSPGKIFALPIGGGKPAVLFDPGESHLLAMTTDIGGGLLVGSSEKAILYRVSPDGRATAVHDFDATELRDVVVTATGVIYAAVNQFPLKTSGMPRYDRPKPGESGTPMSKAATKKKKAAYQPAELRPGAKKGKGALYRIDAEGRVEELLKLDKSYFTDLALDDAGEVWAADGTEGKVYRIKRDRRVMTAFDLSERQVLTLALSGSKQLLGTGDAGAVYVVDSKPAHPAYLSDVFDAKVPARWGSLCYQASGRLKLLSRSGNTAKPDDTWSSWRDARPQVPGRVMLVSPTARYLQLRAIWSDRQTVLRSFTTYYRPVNQRARVTEIAFKRKQNKEKKRTSVIEISWKVDNPDKDDLVYHLLYREELGVAWQPIKTAEPITKTKHEWETEVVPDGRYRIKVLASDEQANGPESTLSGQRISAPVLVDNRKPTLVGVTVKHPWVSGMVRDSFARIKRIEYAIDGGPWRMVSAGDGIYDSPTERFSIRLPGHHRGPHVLAVRAIDAADNAAVTQVRFTIR